ncbi:TPA: metallophosphoesterase family protein [Vibrio harveyi]|uniref:metallophosphoesterase family protein n=1 Tax=Vibrio harveyi TaxID=669 RepID=UPI002B73B3DC|nr:metallophosphoesterase [Vibrio harveyi]
MNSKIAIISDLHCGRGSIAKDFCIGETSNAVIPDFFEDFKAFVKRDSINADYLLVSGDITHEADEQEFELAEQRINDCANALGVPAERVLVIPGNHDGNWEDEKKAVEQQKDQITIQKRKYKNFRALSLNIAQQGKATFGSLTEPPWFSVHDLNPFTVIAINSAAHDSATSDVHHGSVCSKTVEGLEDWLKENKQQLQDRCVILLLHHHPVQYPDYPYEDADLSILNNAGQLMNLATNYDIGFIVHGHKHIPQIKLHIDEVMHPVNIICAGSFSSRLDDRWLQGQGNFFHIIDVSLEDVKLPKGKLISWARYSGHGWINWQQKKLVGVNHIENFGNSLRFDELKSNLKHILEQLFSTKDHVKWDEVLHKEVSFSYCHSRLIEKVIQSLESELDFETHPIKEATSFVFIKAGV